MRAFLRSLWWFSGLERVSEIIRSPLGLSLVIVTVLYWTIATLFIPRRAIEFVDGIVISCSVMVIGVYGRRFLHGLSSKRPDVFDLVICGIAGGWLVNAVDRLWRLISRVTGSWWMMDHHIIGYMLTLLALFACFHLIVRGHMTDQTKEQDIGIVTMEAWGVITVAVICGVALGSLAVATDYAYLGPD